MFCHSYVSLPEGNNSIQFPEFALDGKTNTIQRFPVDSQVEKPTRPSENPRFINPSGDGKNKWSPGLQLPLSRVWAVTESLPMTYWPICFHLQNVYFMGHLPEPFGGDPGAPASPNDFKCWFNRAEKIAETASTYIGIRKPILSRFFFWLKMVIKKNLILNAVT